MIELECKLPRHARIGTTPRLRSSSQAPLRRSQPEFTSNWIHTMRDTPTNTVRQTLARQASLARPSMSANHHPVQNQASNTYRNIDLNAYHDGSLQRFIDLDRVRSRLSRLETQTRRPLAPHFLLHFRLCVLTMTFCLPVAVTGKVGHQW